MTNECLKINLRYNYHVYDKLDKLSIILLSIKSYMLNIKKETNIKKKVIMYICHKINDYFDV